MNAVKMMRYLLQVGASYFKRIALILPFVLIFVWIQAARGSSIQGGLPAIGFIGFVFVNFVILFPLSVLDKAPQAFAFLPQRKADVVHGIYLLLSIVMAVLLCVGLAACAIGTQGAAGGLYSMMLAAGLVLISVTQGALVPCILRFGFAKAQPLMFVCIFGVSALIGAVFKQFYHVLGQSAWKWILDVSHPVLPVLSLILFAAVILWISYLVSLRLYRNKDI